MVNFFIVRPDPVEILYGTLIPTIPSGTWKEFVGLIGAVIMPHNLYLHSSLVLSRKINMKSKSAINEANIYNAIESSISLFVSFLVNFAIIVTFAYWHVNSMNDP
jgi:NRAMP (natural resistance-associated macrophage protein)-like metal ion transporter